MSQLNTNNPGDTVIHDATPPAGFREITEEGSWCGEFHGPEEWTGNITVTSRWNALNREIEFDIYSTVDGHANFDRAELEEIPGMIKSVLYTIDLAEAKAFFERFPEPFEGVPTVLDLARLADDNNLKAPEVFQAYMELIEGDSK